MKRQHGHEGSFRVQIEVLQAKVVPGRLVLAQCWAALVEAARLAIVSGDAPSVSAT